MLSFFETLITYIEMFVVLVRNFLTGIVHLFSLLGEGLFLPTTLIKFVPSFLVPCIIVVNAVAVIKVIFARGNK